MKIKSFFKLIIAVAAVVVIIGSIFAIRRFNYSGNLEQGIRGTVLLGPICPVVKVPPDPDCADRPYAAKLVLTTADQSRVITEFSSGADGRFEIKTRPGEYAIRSAVAANVLPYCASGDTIKVNPDSFAETTVYCDSGIR